MESELIRAAKTGNIEEARHLLAQGADIDVREDFFAATALLLPRSPATKMW